ncbi:creatininase family protein [Porticoccus sp. W117]|uniref:creatininase family protein n=1 Tax=Porticoccus sp. W117 TaxID=3054777 RepID=UPI002592EB27|nr:creatininase family protein [Porticoccus sp. W117]MDM3871899.1 creatininase family protein [Porticoccus sp. W117]
MKDYSLDRITTEDFGAAIDSDRPVIILLPVGSVEPHGPHLTLLTDTVISQGCAELAAQRLEKNGMTVFIAPAVPYGVTDCAAAFKGAVSIPEPVLTDYLAAVVQGFLDNGVDHVCLINNHLEPEHYSAVRQVPKRFDDGKASLACPLSRRWARTLSDEFKRGECHAGRYETAIVLATDANGVKQDVQKTLPEVPVSLSDNILAGVNTFDAMGMENAYAGAPALATKEEGDDMLDRLATMVVTEVLENLG